jgi:hypothetical protein
LRTQSYNQIKYTGIQFESALLIVKRAKFYTTLTGAYFQTDYFMMPKSFFIKGGWVWPDTKTRVAVSRLLIFYCLNIQ